MARLSKKRLLGLCRDTLRRWFRDPDDKPINFDKLPDADRQKIIAAAEECRTPLGAKFAIEEAYRSLKVERLDAAEGQQGSHR